MTFDDKDIYSILRDICIAENYGIPGPAKHAWVVAEQIRRHTTSPSPIWIWLLIKLLDTLIPEIIEWLKKKYGDKWPEKVLPSIEAGALPWQS